MAIVGDNDYLDDDLHDNYLMIVVKKILRIIRFIILSVIEENEYFQDSDSDSEDYHDD